MIGEHFLFLEVCSILKHTFCILSTVALEHILGFVEMFSLHIWTGRMVSRYLKSIYNLIFLLMNISSLSKVLVLGCFESQVTASRPPSQKLREITRSNKHIIQTRGDLRQSTSRSVEGGSGKYPRVVAPSFYECSESKGNSMFIHCF
jgi:hypothetical protein